jgi:16S rRNA (guanine1207-N2)-methyltransferase
LDLASPLAEGAPQRLANGLWSQPGVFSWDRLDPGTALLLDHLPALQGRGADFGAGIGWLGKAVLASPKVEGLRLIELDRRAVEAARRNVDDERASFEWADVRQAAPALSNLDFVVMNPPFHDGGTEDRALGQAFIRAASAALRPGGVLWVTANRHLPYEATLTEAFKTVKPVADAGGYKVYEARR